MRDARPAHRWTAAAIVVVALAFLAGYLVSGGRSGDRRAATSVAERGGTSSQPVSPALQTSEVTTRFPVLTVVAAGQSHEGRVVDVTLTLNRDPNSSASFQVAFLEDTPGGHGTQLRSSVWMAAMVAALQRDADLAGCRLSASIPGTVDGPSAGSALCLAILGLLDGRQYPQDLAVTGTILPDGSIGQVAGISHKLQAAGKRGIHRVIVPEHLRFESPPGNAGLVDLKAAADRAHVAFLPAAEISRAFKIAYQDSASRPSASAPDSAKTHPELDAFLAARSVTRLSEAVKTWEALDAEPGKPSWNEQYRKFIGRDAQSAVEALEAGYVLSGHSDARSFHAAVEASKRWQPLLRSLADKPTAAATEQLDAALAAALRPFHNPVALAEGWIVQTNRSPFATQYFVDLETLCATPLAVTVAGPAFLNADKNSPESHPGPDAGKPAPSNPDADRRMKEVQLLVAMTGQATLDSARQDLIEISRMLPVRAISPGRADRVERLFHSVLTAVDQTILMNVVGPLAEKLQLSPADVIRRLVEEDLLFLYYAATWQTAERMHDRLEQLRARGEPSELLAAATAQLCATQVAVASGILVKWTELGSETDEEGATRFGRKATLARLLWAARENAIRNLHECAARDIPCPRAIESLQDAELMRDDRDSDPVLALITYWKAALQAQALRLLFHSGEVAASR